MHGGFAIGRLARRESLCSIITIIINLPPKKVASYLLGAFALPIYIPCLRVLHDHLSPPLNATLLLSALPPF
jgi:hypothetical protein